MNPTKVKYLLWALGVALIVGAGVMCNLAIMYSSQPHYRQEGWAIFCALNAFWVAGLGVISLLLAESQDMKFRQLDYDRKHEEATT